MSTIIGNAVIVSAPEPNKILDKNTWKVIKKVSDQNQGQNYWAVGDCKQITMNGKVSDGLTLTDYTAWVYIIGFNHNAEKEGNGIAFQGFKATDKGTDVCLVDSVCGYSMDSGTWFNMNNSNSNSGGWQASRMRTVVMPLIKASFPADLQSAIKTSTIYTAAGTGNIACTASDDDVFLLGEYEVSGARTNATSQESNYLKQYAYYSAGNSKVKYKHNSTSSAVYWRLRSPAAGISTTFCIVSAIGDASGAATSNSYGVSPVFKI